MEDAPEKGEVDLQAQIDELTRRLAASDAQLDALSTRADVADVRADTADVRADTADVRADTADDRASRMETRATLDRELVAELQVEGVLGREHAEQMEQALRSSRIIGAAIGMLMASRGVSEDDAFAILVKASQQSNRKLRELAAELVARPDLIDPGRPSGGRQPV